MKREPKPKSSMNMGPDGRRYVEIAYGEVVLWVENSSPLAWDGRLKNVIKELHKVHLDRCKELYEEEARNMEETFQETSVAPLANK